MRTGRTGRLAAALALGAQLCAAPSWAGGDPEPAAAETKPELVIVNGIVMGETWPGPEEKLYSQANEELIIRDFFGDRRGGFFVDVGCSEAVKGSTTFYLEKHLEWSGIGIDAVPDYGPLYIMARPRTQFENYLVTDHSGTVEEFYQVPGTMGLSSTIPDREFAGIALEAKRIQVPTITLNELLEKSGVEKIDFLSMDIEGSEPQALAGFDIERFRPGLVCIERGGNDTVIESYFNDHGYERIAKYEKYDHVNWYFEPSAQHSGKGSNWLVVRGITHGESWPGPEQKRYSQGNEELIIRHFFKDRKDGFFVDLGSAHPIEDSTTYYLEKHLGWSGIGLDALPELAPAYEKERPRTAFENYIVTDHSGTHEEFFRVSVAPGLSSTQEKRSFMGAEVPGEKIRVPTITLDGVLEKHGVEEIDFLSIDIEGGEPQALAGFDIERFRPELVCVERQGREEALTTYFAAHGYERIDEYRRYDHINWYFRPARARPGGDRT